MYSKLETDVNFFFFFLSEGMKGFWRDDDDDMESDEESSPEYVERVPNGGELITIACGHHSGYATAHFYNAHLASALANRDARHAALQAAQPYRTLVQQPPVLSDALFAPSLDASDIHAIPRAVFIDLHGACFAPSVHPVAPAPVAQSLDVKQGSVQSNAEHTFATWAGKVSVMGDISPSLAARDPETAQYIRSIMAAISPASSSSSPSKESKPSIAPKGASPAVGGTVSDVMRRPESWGDVLGCRTSSRSLCEVRGITHGADAWSAWDDAADIIASSTSGLREDVSDSVRYFAEGCDRVCGIQLVADMDSAFAAVAASVLADIRDEYSRSTPVAVFGTSSLFGAGRVGLDDVPSSYATATPMKRNALVAQRRLCNALAAASWAEFSDLVLPLACPPPPLRQQRSRTDERTCMERAASFGLFIHSFARPYATPPTERNSFKPGSSIWSLSEVCTMFQPSKFTATSIRLGNSAMPQLLMPFSDSLKKDEVKEAFAMCSTGFNVTLPDGDKRKARRTLQLDSSQALVVPSSLQDTCVDKSVATTPLHTEAWVDTTSVAYFDGLSNLLFPYLKGSVPAPVGFQEMNGLSFADLNDSLMELRGTQKYVLE